MNKNNPSVLSTVLFIFVILIAGFGLKEMIVKLTSPPVVVSIITETKQPHESAEFISGQLVANLGELCVFKLSDPNTRADWVIVPPTTCYIDSSGSSIAFASNVPAKYTIIAAIIDGGDSVQKAKILTHICEYGVSPEPEPLPNPSPTPNPSPNPVTLSNWVTQNIPQEGHSQATALGSCYESAATSIENGTIKTQDAAFSIIRTATQTKISIDVWQTFLDKLSGKITERLNGSLDIKKLGTLFSEIAIGLKAISDTKISVEPEVSTDTILDY
jgi:hypothetical protein